MLLSEVLNTVRGDSGRHSAIVGNDWLQGRTLFGGLQVALIVRALRASAPAEVPLRVIQATFIAPVPAGEVQIQTRLLRVGKSVMHCEGRIVAGDQTLCLVMAIFGRGRDSSLHLAQTLPVDPDASTAREIPYVEGITPAFTKHYRMRWIAGGTPFTGATEAKTRVLVRNRQPQPLDECHLLGYADVIPSPALSMLRRPSPASSLTWTLELFRHKDDDDPSADWCMDAEVTQAADGYLAQTAALYAPDGTLAALSRQCVVAFG
ncbi:acyl-CoA thioesterase [Sinimarinibacterium sp. CAU 1509]|uniref:acyl-CoA thioesterase n=1 Tax=Sinimarinibacterium sp. CAU 1509 TaxID=2562283 RepID=UPI001B7FB16F|nr:thioesterase family protein [Sinimarinibacterium sp. CAU 1509]